MDARRGTAGSIRGQRGRLYYSFGDVAGRRLKTGALRLGTCWRDVATAWANAASAGVSRSPISVRGPDSMQPVMSASDSGSGAATRGACRALRWLTFKDPPSTVRWRPMTGRLAKQCDELLPKGLRLASDRWVTRPLYAVTRSRGGRRPTRRSIMRGWSAAAPTKPVRG
jgi:hypothetical protein